MTDLGARTPEQEAYGHIAEHRFFELVGRGRPRVRGFVRAEQASPLLDVRGVDGFIYHYRRSYSTQVKRIPVQIKCGLRHGITGINYYGYRIPIVPVSLDMDPHFMADRVRQLLDAYEAKPIDYESNLREMETSPPSPAEQRVMALIEKNRRQFAIPEPAHA